MNPGCLSADQLAAYESGEGTPQERAAISTHLRECEQCRRELAWLGALRGQVEQLPRSIAPTRELWDGIAPRLEPRVIPAHRPRRTPFIMLAAAAVVLMLLSAAITALLLRRSAAPGPRVATELPAPRPVAPAGSAPGSAASLARLASQVRALERALPPETRALVAHHLALIDAAIRESEAALAADSTNPAIQRMLEARYEQRLGLLEQARRAAPES
jgi:anti-sigma factor RsiW